MPASSEPTVQNDTVVYILGAGFSRAAGFPLMHDFMTAMRDCHTWLAGDESRGQERQAIDEVLNFRLRAAAAAYRAPIDIDNVETLFSLASALRDPALDGAMGRALCATLDYAADRFDPCREWLDLESSDHTLIRAGVRDPDRRDDGTVFFKADRYAQMSGALYGVFVPSRTGARNVVITFNYDTLVEQALRRLGVPVTYGLAPQDPELAVGALAPVAPLDGQARVIFKLHGSMNWTLEDGAIAVHPDYETARRAEGPPVVVPPTWRAKAQEDVGTALERVWLHALRALQDATHVVVIGYSAPSVDAHFRHLLAAGLMDNVSLRSIRVVNPAIDKGLRKRFVTQVVRPELESRGVLAFDQVPAELFLASRGHMSQIGRKAECAALSTTARSID